MPICADKLVRMYRDARGEEIARLERLAKRLGVPPHKARQVILDVIAYRLTLEEAEKRLKRVARET
ncbi:hypothetical protein Pyrfu_0520 [Pyrolobus fumarii 1A]|uniref:Uncharacterized protein n=1 Tax=Pyrolobus fumarii (strain DSM 11204 / 1A) TaxID=694429 RepID=G0EGL7_PYRF1|nr:hypothetical protein [Pyrolobus fumarii]AEM38391.1 hypothetical protein Pyrfu_0520 [Pyrolobus fumarii 1A]